MKRALLGLALLFGVLSITSVANGATAQEYTPKKTKVLYAAYQNLHDVAQGADSPAYAGRNVAKHGRAKDGKIVHALVKKEFWRLWWELHPEAHKEYRRLQQFKGIPNFREAYLRNQSHLESIASCESGGRLDAVSGNGLYYGKYQFALSTWRAVGGSGNPIQAPEEVQDHFAGINYEVSNPYGQWPVCSRR